MPVIIDGTLGVNAAAVTTTNWNPTNLTIPGNATIGDASSDTLTINGASVTFAGTATRIKADFSNDTVANQAFFQTTIANTSTQLRAIPNGNGTQSGLFLYGSSDIDNNSWGAIRTVAGVDVRIQSHTTGTGTLLPITFMTGTTERMRIDASGNIGIGITPSYKLDVSSPGFPVARLNSTYSSGGKTFSSLIMGTTTGNSGAQFGFVLNEATPANSFAHITYYGTGEGTGLVVGSTGVGVGGDGSIRGKFSVLTSGSFNAVGDSVNVGANFVGPNYDFNSSGNPTLLNIESNTAAGINVGATIGLGGQYNTATQKAQFAIIKAAKENATNDNYATYLAFGTRAHGANIQERMRINSAGNVGIGKTNPGTTLDVAGTIQAVHNLGGALGIRIAADSTNAKAALQFTNNAAVNDWMYLEARSAAHTTWRISNGSDTNSDYAAFGINGGPVGIRDITTAGGEASDWPVPSLSIASYDNYTANTMLAFMLKDDVNYMTDLSKWNFRLYHGSGQTTSDASTALGLGGPGNLYLQANGAGGIQLTTSGVERMRVRNTGSVAFLNAINGIAVVPDYTNVDGWNWVKLGRITGAQSAGGAMKITIVGAMGYNADPLQSGEDVIYIRGSNGNSQGGRNVGGTFYRHGSGSGNRVVSQVKAKSVNGVSYDNEYDVYALIHSGLSRYCSYRVEHSPDWSWTWSVTNAGSTDPGAESSTLAVFKNSWGVTAYDGTYFNGIAAAPSYAFVHFAGAGTIRNSLGVTSVTRINAGSYRVNFNFTWSDANYIGVTGLQRVAASGDFINIGFDRGTTYDRVEFFSGGGTTDPTVLSVAYFRNNP